MYLSSSSTQTGQNNKFLIQLNLPKFLQKHFPKKVPYVCKLLERFKNIITCLMVVFSQHLEWWKKFFLKQKLQDQYEGNNKQKQPDP
tara:strand:- start:114 stop:374 length:261 start_codon:yes stop_codon:yes gene_type:complete